MLEKDEYRNIYADKTALTDNKGQPALWLRADNYPGDEHRRMCDDVCLEFAIYLDEEAAGGCLVYGLTRRGWVINPNLRFPLAELVRRLTAPPTVMQLASACYTENHGFGLLDMADQHDELKAMQQHWRAITSELHSPSQHTTVRATAQTLSDEAQGDATC